MRARKMEERGSERGFEWRKEWKAAARWTSSVVWGEVCDYIAAGQG